MLLWGSPESAPQNIFYPGQHPNDVLQCCSAVQLLTCGAGNVGIWAEFMETQGLRTLGSCHDHSSGDESGPSSSRSHLCTAIGVVGGGSSSAGSLRGAYILQQARCESWSSAVATGICPQLSTCSSLLQKGWAASATDSPRSAACHCCCCQVSCCSSICCCCCCCGCCSSW